MNLRRLLWLLLLVSGVGCSATTATSRVDLAKEKGFVALHAEASEALLRARELGFEWIATEGILEQAEQANANGDSALALHLAGEALLQAELSIEQASREASAWKDRAARWQ